MKRIFCFLLTMFIAASVIPAYASHPTLAADVSDEYMFLEQLGILPPELEAGEYESDKKISRGTFAILLANALNLDGKGILNVSGASFADVGMKENSRTAVNYLAQLSIISGDGSGNFYPKKAVEFSQAVKMVMSALGYADYANQLGGYPTGYMQCAQKADVLDGVAASGDEVTYDSAIKLIANALNTKVLSQNSFGSDNISYESSEATLLSLYHNIYQYSGRVRGTSEAIFLDVEPLSENEVVIDEKRFETTVDCTSFLGTDVCYYVEKNTDIVRAIVPEYGYAQTLIIDAEAIDSFKNNVLTYYDEDGELTSIKISQLADISYNGFFLGEFSHELFEINNGNIKLIKGNDSSYDTVVISEADNFVISAVDKKNKVFYDSYDGKAFSAEKTEVCSFKDEFGNDVSFGELAVNDVVSVYKSVDERYARLYYSNSEIPGEITAISRSGGKLQFQIGDRFFDVASSFEAEAQSLKIGYKGYFVLDVYGDIASAKAPYDDYSYGYLVDIKNSGGLDDSVQAKMMNDSGKVEVYTLSDKVILDGKSVTCTEAYNALQASGGQVIRYSMDSSFVRKIDTFVDGSNEEDRSLNKVYSCYNEQKVNIGGVKWNAYSGIFSAKLATSSDTKVFVVPRNPINDEYAYKVRSISYFTNDSGYAVDAYNINAQSNIADVLVVYTDGVVTSVDTKTRATLVESVSQIIDENGEQVYVINGLRDGRKSVDYLKDESVLTNLKSIVPSKAGQTHTLACGDIVKLEIDAENSRVVYIELYYDRKNDCVSKNTAVCTDLTNANRIVNAHVYAKDNGVAYLTQKDFDKLAEAVPTIDELEAIKYGSYNIYKYDDSGKKPSISVASASDLIDYKSAGTECTEIVMWSMYTNPGIIVIY